jgi:hypothetical protein
MKSQEQAPGLLDQARDVLRLHHCSIHTKRSCTDWIKRDVHFHGMRSREDLFPGAEKLELFLSDDFKNAPGGDFHKARVIHFGGSRAALDQVRRDRYCRSARLVGQAESLLCRKVTCQLRSTEYRI